MGVKVKKVEINEDRCKGCGLCAAFCPKGGLKMAEKLGKKGLYPAELYNEEVCTSCGICAIMCPDAAICVYKPDKS